MATVHLHRDDVPDTLALLNALLGDRTHTAPGYAPDDQGTGSTFSALADRGLVSVQWHRVNVHGQGVPHLR